MKKMKIKSCGETESPMVNLWNKPLLWGSNLFLHLSFGTTKQNPNHIHSCWKISRRGFFPHSQFWCGPQWWQVKPILESKWGFCGLQSVLVCSRCPFGLTLEPIYICCRMVNGTSDDCTQCDAIQLNEDKSPFLWNAFRTSLLGER